MFSKSCKSIQKSLKENVIKKIKKLVNLELFLKNSITLYNMFSKKEIEWYNLN